MTLLDPQRRHVLLTALRPAPGFRVTHAIATTFSVDLLALLTAPLAFSLYDLDEDSAAAEPRATPVTLLQALRSHAEHLTVFHQTGCATVPARLKQLLTFLEGSVVETRAHHSGGLFHPKLWILRMHDGSGEPRYRLLVPTRNLTFDASWDTLLVMDGATYPRRNVTATQPLAELVGFLPSLAVRKPVSERVRVDVELVASELRRVEFEPPEGFESVGFFPIGLPRTRPPPVPDARRKLVISPFITADRLRSLNLSADDVLVSRTEELVAIDAELPTCKLFALNEFADPDCDEHVEAADAPTDMLTDTPPSGLHAKLYAFEGSGKAIVWTGSANATRAGFSENVEILIELTAPKSVCGVDALLGADEDVEQRGNVALTRLLVPYVRGQQESAEHRILKSLESELDEVRRHIAVADLVAVAGRVGPGAAAAVGSEQELYQSSLELRSGRLEIPSHISARCWPVTIPAGQAARLESSDPGPLAIFGNRPFVELTSFVGFELETSRDGVTACIRFTRNLPLEGAPPDRALRQLRALLRDRETLHHMLRLLLAETPAEILEALAALGEPKVGEGEDGRRRASDASGEANLFFEALVRTLHRSPERLDDLHSILSELGDDGCRELLPPDFQPTWQAIWEARNALKRSDGGE